MAVNYQTIACIPEQVFAALANGCPVRLSEDAVASPARLVPTRLSDLGIVYRNTEPLRRLVHLAEDHAD